MKIKALFLILVLTGINILFIEGRSNATSSGTLRDGWRVLPIRSEQEFRKGLVGGEAEQHCQGIARSLSKPNIIYLSHDCGQVWKSD